MASNLLATDLARTIEVSAEASKIYVYKDEALGNDLSKKLVDIRTSIDGLYGQKLPEPPLSEEYIKEIKAKGLFADLSRVRPEPRYPPGVEEEIHRLHVVKDSVYAEWSRLIDWGKTQDAREKYQDKRW